MEMLINLFRPAFGDAVDPPQLGEAGARNGPRRAEMMEERPLAVGADAGNVVEQGMTDAFGPPRAVRADGEAVRLVAQALQEGEHRIAGVETERSLAGHEKARAAGGAVGTLGDRRDGDIGDAELAEHD